MKIVSWNVNGIRAAWNHGLSSFLDTCGADIYAFQETKTDAVFPAAEIEGYHAFWSFCGRRRGYSGTLCLTRYAPLDVHRDLGVGGFDAEGRLLTLEFGEFFLVNCYVPNSRRSGSRYDYRSQWDLHFRQYVERLRHLKPVVVCGDFNATASDADIHAAGRASSPDAVGFQSTERESLVGLVGDGFVDSYRHVHPDGEGKYTWWSNRRYKRRENRGWRLDYFLVSEALKERITESTMLTDVYGSDHCPLLLEIDVLPGETGGPAPAGRPGSPYTYRDLAGLEEGDFILRHVRRTDMTGLWKSVDWERAERNLGSMQGALAKAAYTRDRGLIARWQGRIVRSLDAKLLAVRHTCDTAGGAGVDHVRWTTPHEKMSAALSLTSRGYRAMPSRLLLIKSKNGKQRRVHIETYHDRAMQCLYAYALDPVAESWGDRKSFAYRKGRSSHDMDGYIRRGLSGDDAPAWVFVADVRKCYESISHEWIMEHIPLPGHVLHQFLKAGYVFGGELFPTDAGVGIGCSISPIVANMTLDGLQDYVYSRLYPHGDGIDYPDGNMVRYADDILFTARTEETARRIRAYTADFLEERGLALSPEKSRIVNMADGFTFMSRTYYRSGTRVLARPSDAAVGRFMGSVRDTVDGYTGSQKSLIDTLNRKIDGWTAYHKVGEAGEAFRQMDVYISASLLELCESKHPGWDRDRILRKYWYTDARGRHCYALPDKKEVRVKFLSDTLPVDYHAVRTGVNPYIDPGYTERRTRERQVFHVTGVYRAVWDRQGGRCHYCGHRISRDEGKALVEVNPGGSRLASRVAYVHRRCLRCSFDHVDVASSPASLDEVRELLERLESGREPAGRKFHALSGFFRACDRDRVALTFGELEEIMGDSLGATSLRKEFWYRTGFSCISQCWLGNGYVIKELRVEERRVVFGRAAGRKDAAGVAVPEAIRHGPVPADARYELENYFRYIVKKYGL